MLRRTTPVLLAAFALASVIASSRAAHAQTIDPAQAATLFETGREALARRDYDRACAAFAESLKLDVKTGTLLNLADCEEHRGELSHAFAHWQQAVDRARAAGDDRLAFLQRRRSELDARIPKLTLRLTDDAPAGATVRRDGIEQGPASLGEEIPVDSGRHVVEAVAPGYASRRYEIDLAEGMHGSLAVAPGAGLPGSRPLPDSPTLARSPSPTPRPLATAGVLTAGAGLVALGIGTAFGLAALGKRGDLLADPHCTRAGACDSEAGASQWNARRDDAQLLGNVSTATLIVGGVALITGAVLWLSAGGSAGGATAWR